MKFSDEMLLANSKLKENRNGKHNKRNTNRK